MARRVKVLAGFWCHAAFMPPIARFLRQFTLRLALFWAAALLSACGTATGPALGIAGAVTVASVATLGRTPPDALYSLASGRDCSLVRMERGESYCRPEEPPWEEAPICTRSLGVVDCWRNPEAFGAKLTPVADGPKPTAEQEAYRLRRWPDW